MGIAFDDTQLVTGDLAALRVSRQLLEKHIDGQPMQAFVRARYEDALTLIDSALDAMTCETCDRAVVIDREAGAFCQSCSDRFVVCDGCKQDVPISDAVAPVGAESGFYHGPCCPDLGWL